MKKTITALVALAAISLPAYAASGAPQKKVLMPELTQTRASETAGDELIMERPQGEATIYNRTGITNILQGWSAYHGEYSYVCGEIIKGDDGFVYIKNPVSQFATGAYVKGTEKDGIITVELPQAVKAVSSASGNSYITANRMVKQGDDYVVVTENNMVQFKADGDKWILDLPEDESECLGICFSDTWTGCADYSAVYTPFSPEPISIPDNLLFEDWQLTANKGIGIAVKVAFDNNDIYVKNISAYLPDAVIKGSIEGQKAVFPSGQYLGVDDTYFCFDYFIAAEVRYDDSGMMTCKTLDNAEFDYSDGKMTYAESVLINGGLTDISYLDLYENPIMQRLPEDMDYTPAPPSFTLFSEYDEAYGDGTFGFELQAFNIDGFMLDVKNISYSIYEDGEIVTFVDSEGNRLTEIPYGLEIEPLLESYKNMVFYNFTIDGLQTIGVKAFYNADGKKYTSDTLTVDAVSGEWTVGVESVISESDEVVATAIYDLTGRPVTEDYKGFCIKTVTYKNGTIKSIKTCLD